jgi:hypothetical protein
MNAATFKKWFEEDFLVMDNASYHLKQWDKPPSTNSRKADIMAWLSSKNITFTASQIRHELLKLVKMNKSPPKDYKLDCIAQEHGHRVVHLSSYHCQYNTTELVWAQVKGYVAEWNTTFKIADTDKLVHQAVDSISVSAWADCVRHAAAGRRF